MVQKTLLINFSINGSKKLRWLGVGIKMGDNVPCFILTGVL